MRTFAFIFARGGSKGIPGKNLRELGGQPLIVHSIKMAQRLDCIDRIFVSTDSDDIAAVARSHNVEVIGRPSELATDTAPEWEAWQHSISHVQNSLDAQFDVFLSLPCTSPLRAPADIERCISALSGDVDVVISMTPSARSPYFNMVVHDDTGHLRLVVGSSGFKRRQDVPVVFDVTTVAYVSRPDFILNNNSLFDGKVTGVSIPRERAIDIDDEFDFLIAETLIKQ
jgi:N-acylneuraminate cytidylyltransferase